MSEQKLQSKIQKYLQAQGCYVFKTITTNKAGIPDLIVCRPKGSFLALEVKIKGNKASALQEYNIETIRATGGEAYVVYSLDEVKELFE